MRSLIRPAAALALLLLVTGSGRAQEQFGKVVEDVNKKMVKIFGTGGFKGLASYGTGLIVSADGYILTCDSPLLTTQDLRVHLPDGRRFDHVKVVATEPELDVALLKLEKVEDLPFFDIAKSAQAPVGQTGDLILAFSNQFQIATRDEPMSVQRGVVASYSKLHGRRGVHEAPYTGDVYIVDTICCNPGAGGGALTTRKGQLLGIIGKELRNSQTDTWINYAMPLQAKVEVPDKDDPKKKTTVTLTDFIRLGIEGKYKAIDKPKIIGGTAGYTGVVLVPNILERTPPYVEDVLANSPAAKAGLKPDDLIVYIDGEQVVSVNIYKDIMSKIRPGSEIALEVRRGEKLKTIRFKVEEPIVKAPPKKD